MHKAGHAETLKHRFTQEDFDRFAALTGDNNPIHVDPEFCARTHFGRTVAHGMLQYGTICRVLSTQYSGPGVLQIKQELMFQNPTYTQTEITIKCCVNHYMPDQQQAEITTVISLPDGKLACDGSTRVHLPGWQGGFAGIDEKMSAAGDSEAQTLKGLKIGQAAVVRRIFSTADLSEYTDLTRDTNPLNA